MKNYLFIACLLAIGGCQVNNKTQKNTQEMEHTSTNTLAVQLSQKSDLSAQKFSAEKLKTYSDGIVAIEKSGLLEKALNVGDKASNFVLKNQNGTAISLYDELKNGPVVLTWYRGGWCPYCNINLHYLQERLPDFEAAGASLIALTPELPDASLNTSEKNDLKFNVLSDVDNVIGKAYGVVFELTPEVADIYQKAFDLHGYNGNDSNELPLAVSYVIDSEGIIQYAFLNADYKKRAEPDDIIAALGRIKH